MTTTTTATARYIPQGDTYSWASEAQKILALCEESKNTPSTKGDGYLGLGYPEIRQLLTLTEGLDPSWENLVFLSCQDLLAGPSFIWDLKNGPIPETGSRQTVAHTPFPLGAESGLTRHWVEANLPKGEYSPCQGFSYSKCHKKLAAAQAVLGKKWACRIDLEMAQYEWAENRLILVASHKEVHGLTLGLVAEGLGRIRPMSGQSRDLLEAAGKGTQFVTVLDTHHSTRQRTGQMFPSGGCWQYP